MVFVVEVAFVDELDIGVELDVVMAATFTMFAYRFPAQGFADIIFAGGKFFAIVGRVPDSLSGGVPRSAKAENVQHITNAAESKSLRMFLFMSISFISFYK